MHTLELPIQEIEEEIKVYTYELETLIKLAEYRYNKTSFFLKSEYMLPHIFHIDIYFICLSD